MHKKTVLITGAAKGIGRETARLFATEYNVVIDYLTSETEARQLLAELGECSMIYKADVSSEVEVAGMVKASALRFGGVDVVVNNAAVAEQKMFCDITGRDWDKMFDINVKGMYNVISETLPYMVSRKSGRIINISSVWGMVGSSCEVHYSATKAAVIGMTKALAKELAPSGILVNCVAPGVIDTDMNKNLTQDDINKIKDDTPLETIGTARDIANMIYFLASDKANFITGQIISPNGGFVI